MVLVWHRAAGAIAQRLANLPGEPGVAQVATLKAVVTQASSAIPVVPLYVSLLFKVMKDAGCWFTFLPPYSLECAAQTSIPSKWPYPIDPGHSPTCEAIAQVCDLYSPQERWNYFKAVGYVSG